MPFGFMGFPRRISVRSLFHHLRRAEEDGPDAVDGAVFDADEEGVEALSEADAAVAFAE